MLQISKVVIFFQVLTERMGLEKPKSVEPDSNYRIENSGRLMTSVNLSIEYRA